jgi:hypothetical protein
MAKKTINFSNLGVFTLFFLVLSGITWWGTQPIRDYLEGVELHPLTQLTIAVVAIVAMGIIGDKLGIKK